MLRIRKKYLSFTKEHRQIEAEKMERVDEELRRTDAEK